MKYVCPTLQLYVSVAETGDGAVHQKAGQHGGQGTLGEGFTPQIWPQNWAITWEWKDKLGKQVCCFWGLSAPAVRQKIESQGTESSTLHRLFRIRIAIIDKSDESW